MQIKDPTEHPLFRCIWYFREGNRALTPKLCCPEEMLLRVNTKSHCYFMLTAYVHFKETLRTQNTRASLIVHDRDVLLESTWLFASKRERGTDAELPSTHSRAYRFQPLSRHWKGPDVYRLVS